MIEKITAWAIPITLFVGGLITLLTIRKTLGEGAADAFAALIGLAAAAALVYQLRTPDGTNEAHGYIAKALLFGFIFGFVGGILVEIITRP